MHSYYGISEFSLYRELVPQLPPSRIFKG